MRKRGLSLLLAGVVVLGSANLEFVSEAEQKALKEAEKEGYYDTDVIEIAGITAM